jgi:hypothetical protein
VEPANQAALNPGEQTSAQEHTVRQDQHHGQSGHNVGHTARQYMAHSIVYHPVQNGIVQDVVGT